MVASNVVAFIVTSTKNRRSADLSDKRHFFRLNANKHDKLLIGPFFIAFVKINECSINNSIPSSCGVFPGKIPIA